MRFSGSLLRGLGKTHHVAVAAVQKSSMKYNQFMAGPEWHSSYPGFAGGAPNYVTRWGPDSEPFWEFQLKSAAARVRHAAGTQADPGARTLGSEDADVVAEIWNPAVPTRLPNLASVFDVIDARVDALIPMVRALPYREQRDVISDICENLEHTRRLCGHSAEQVAPGTLIPPGLDQAADLMLMLNYVAVDCEHGGPYPRS